MKAFEIRDGVIAVRLDMTRDEAIGRFTPDYVASLVDLPDQTPIGWIWNGVEAVPPPPIPVTRDDVNSERDRRIAFGFSFAGHPIQADAASRASISEMVSMAATAIEAGALPGDLRWFDADLDFFWITSDNAMVPMDAQTMHTMGEALARYKSRCTYAAAALKALPVIPNDYKDNAHWPQPG